MENKKTIIWSVLFVIFSSFELKITSAQTLITNTPDSLFVRLLDSSEYLLVTVEYEDNKPIKTIHHFSKNFRHRLKICKEEEETTRDFTYKISRNIKMKYHCVYGGIYLDGLEVTFDGKLAHLSNPKLTTFLLVNGFPVNTNSTREEILNNLKGTTNDSSNDLIVDNRKFKLRCSFEKSGSYISKCHVTLSFP